MAESKLRILSLFLSAILAFPLYAGYFKDPCFFSEWEFAPVQVDVCFIDRNAKLVDENANTILALGLFTLRVRRNDSEFSGHK